MSLGENLEKDELVSHTYLPVKYKFLAISPPLCGGLASNSLRADCKRVRVTAKHRMSSAYHRLTISERAASEKAGARA